MWTNCCINLERWIFVSLSVPMPDDHNSKTKLNENVSNFQSTKAELSYFPNSDRHNIFQEFTKSLSIRINKKEKLLLQFAPTREVESNGGFLGFPYDRYVPASFSSNRLFVTEVGLSWLLWSVTETCLRCGGLKLWRSQN